jgi:hypothetical protein
MGAHFVVLTSSSYLKAVPVGETLLVVSYDRQMNLCARALGFSTPLADEAGP